MTFDDSRLVRSVLASSDKKSYPTVSRIIFKNAAGDQICMYSPIKSGLPSKSVNLAENEDLIGVFGSHSSEENQNCFASFGFIVRVTKNKATAAPDTQGSTSHKLSPGAIAQT